MNIRNILIILPLFFATCNPAQQNPDRAEIRKMFNIAGGVREIQTESILVTTTGENAVNYLTTFRENGTPVETTNYNKDGKIEKTEPWVSAKNVNLRVQKLKKRSIKING